MYWKISHNVKLAAINLHKHQHLALEDIFTCIGFSESTFWQILKIWCKTGDVVRHTFGICGRPHTLHCNNVLYLIHLIHHHPKWFLDELLQLLDTNCFISIHYTTIHHKLTCVGISLKKLKWITKERNEEKPMNFLIHMSQYSPEHLGFLDETSKDECTAGWLHGRAATNGMAASCVVKGSFTTVKYLEFLQSMMVFANVFTLSWTFVCPCNGQCKDTSWRRCYGIDRSLW
ncbi:hypothetical protein BDR04DRAFT_1130493 [Suillus decipiens]|nr:hypothetical protein BDR04DRAFT_1130493 [Suillus decipiens]